MLRKTFVVIMIQYYGIVTFSIDSLYYFLKNLSASSVQRFLILALGLHVIIGFFLYAYLSSCVSLQPLVFQALKCVVLCIILAPYDNEQADLIQRVKTEKFLEDIPLYR